MQTVYESSLAVEAHMIADLLRRAGIPAQILGEVLQGGAGELPLGSLVRVVVPDDRAAEAREVIADWERALPSSPPLPSPPSRRSWAPWTFVLGLALGVGGMALALKTPMTFDGTDYDGDGVFEEQVLRLGEWAHRVDFDRNEDGKVDAIQHYDVKGLPTRYQGDDDFDGRLELDTKILRGQFASSSVDRDGDGGVDLVCRYVNGVTTECDFLAADGDRILKREHYRGGVLDSAEFDADEDGRFERSVRYDWMGEPVTAGP